ncbi:hypothetical protein RRG08_013235 [Elysia crispata]|uniref:Uncharacterized protein n=1 Tax=Elysia crispata TaxID=231223 RepID=A0AAE1AHH9_9GAST|nr:hypothetical protein RRG08_013235 [Elysia crispata]
MVRLRGSVRYGYPAPSSSTTSSSSSWRTTTTTHRRSKGNVLAVESDTRIATYVYLRVFRYTIVAVPQPRAYILFKDGTMRPEAVFPSLTSVTAS